MLASRQQVMSLPAGAGLAAQLWCLKGTLSHHPCPLQCHPSLGSFSRPHMECVLCCKNCFYLSFLHKLPLLIHLLVHMLGLATGEIIKEDTFGFGAHTHRRLSILTTSSPWPFTDSPTLSQVPSHPAQMFVLRVS